MGTIKCFGFPQPHGLLLEERHSPERTACRAWHSQRLALSEVKEQPWQQNGDCLVGWEARSPPPKQTLHGAGWGEVGTRERRLIGTRTDGLGFASCALPLPARAERKGWLSGGGPPRGPLSVSHPKFEISCNPTGCWDRWAPTLP